MSEHPEGYDPTTGLIGVKTDLKGMGMECNYECGRCRKTPTSCEGHRCNWCVNDKCQVRGMPDHIWCSFLPIGDSSEMEVK